MAAAPAAPPRPVPIRIIDHEVTTALLAATGLVAGVDARVQPAMRVAITESVIAEARRRGGAQELWDATVRGLALRILATGRASWLVRTWTGTGKRTSIKIGEHPALKPAEARKMALVQLGAVQQGRDPVGERRAARAARRAAAKAVTVAQGLRDWQRARERAAERPWAPSYSYRVGSALRTHLPARLLAQPLAEVRRETWTRLLAKVAAERPGSGAFLYTVVSSFLSYAEAMGWIFADAATAIRRAYPAMDAYRLYTVPPGVRWPGPARTEAGRKIEYPAVVIRGRR